MKNKEKFAKEIVEIACNGDAIAISKTTGKPNRCGNVGCEDCMRYTGRPGCAEKRLKEWAESEYIEKLAISKKDRAFLEYLEGYKYISRNGDGKLYAYKSMPIKASDRWENGICRNLAVLDIIFPMVKWEDDEPWLIEDLKKLEVVEEYE